MYMFSTQEYIITSNIITSNIVNDHTSDQGINHIPK